MIGGSFVSYANLVRCTCHFMYNPDHCANTVGFRIVLSPFLKL